MKDNFLVGENATLGLFNENGEYEEIDLKVNEKYKVIAKDMETLKYTGFDDSYLYFETEEGQSIEIKIKNIRSIEQV